MPTTIALLRGINVGGKNKLPMQALRRLLAELGLNSVRTYIQSGNVVFDHAERPLPELAERIETSIESHHGFRPRILLIPLPEFEAALSNNPYPEGEGEPKSLHLYFLAIKPSNPELPKLHTLKKESERFTLRGKVFYLHAPEGIGRSRLAAQVEKGLGVPATARNWRSVNKILEIAK